MVWKIFTCTLNKKTMTCDHEIRQYFNFQDNYRWKWGCGVIKMSQKFQKIMNFYNFTKLWDKIAKTLLWYTFLYRISNIAILWPLTPLKRGLQGWKNLTPKIFRKFTSKSSWKCNKINFRSQIEREPYYPTNGTTLYCPSYIRPTSGTSEPKPYSSFK